VGSCLNDETPNFRENQRRPRVLWRVAAVFVAVCLCLIGAAVWWTYRALQPPDVHSQQTVRLTVNRGESVSEIGQQLEQAGLIRSPLMFHLYVRYRKAGQGLQAGTYDLQPGTKLADIVAKLKAGQVVSDTISVTIPEGFTVSEIADRLEKEGICSRQAFLNEEEHGQFTEPFVSLLPQKKDIKFRLEGYLFPDTYEFSANELAHTVVNAMLQNFQQHIDEQQVMQTLKMTGQSLPDMVTKASMFEKEAQATSDLPLISSVIDNRLRRGMKLQIDATIQYFLGHRDVVTDKDLHVQDPYNTYLHTGLPPGPIASPGMVAIDAALHPAKTTYLFYVAKYDGTGTSYFSSTEAQHLKNIQKSQTNLKKQSQSGKSP
jgi:peptidoglycan lytic transglycosylase G